MYDDNDTIYPGHVIGKLLTIDENILPKLIAQADILLDRKRESMRFRLDVEEGNPVIPNPVILFGNIFKAAANKVLDYYEPPHILNPVTRTVPDSWGHPGVLSGYKIYTKRRISPIMAEAIVAYIERDKENVMARAGITVQELRDLRQYVVSGRVDRGIEIHP